MVKVGRKPGKVEFVGEEKVVKRAKTELYRILKKMYKPAGIHGCIVYEVVFGYKQLRDLENQISFLSVRLLKVRGRD